MTDPDPIRPSAAEAAAHERAEWRSLKDDVEDLTDTAAVKGRGLLDAARVQAQNFAEQRKSDAAQSVHGIAKSLRDSGRTLEDRPHVKAFFDSAADGLEQLGGSIEERSLSDLYAEAESFARRAPVAVAVGTFVVGLVAARFIKSSSASRDRDTLDAAGL